MSSIELTVVACAAKRHADSHYDSSTDLRQAQINQSELCREPSGIAKCGLAYLCVALREVQSYRDHRDKLRKQTATSVIFVSL
jgi:hypothetical protein